MGDADVGHYCFEWPACWERVRKLSQCWDRFNCFNGAAQQSNGEVWEVSPPNAGHWPERREFIQYGHNYYPMIVTLLYESDVNCK